MWSEAAVPGRMGATRWTRLSESLQPDVKPCSHDRAVWAKRARGFVGGESA